MIEKKLFTKYNENNIYMFSLENKFLKVNILNLGGIIHSIYYKGVDVCLGYNDLDAYFKSGTYAGAFIGRVANRIKNGQFTLDGDTYQISINDNGNALHGGINGLDKKVLDYSIDKNTLVLKGKSEDKEEGFPGNLNFEIKYELKGRKLKIVMTGKSDVNSYFSPTMHTYFNMNGDGKENILSNYLKINADFITETGKNLIPTGNLIYIKNKMLDFKKLKKVSEGFKEKGIDSNYVTNKRLQATLKGSAGVLKIYSNLPGIQVYTGYYIHEQGKTKLYESYDGIALEPQFFPDAINNYGFEKPYIFKDKPVSYKIIYKFVK